jgi:butyryl-CoA dehydrogenase
MLLAQKSATEGALALCLYAAVLVDDVRTASDEIARKKAESLLEILTPLVKSWPSENCLEANKLAMQVLGGYGYTRDYPVEQYYRDNRLNLIHEGTHGIQALDLVNRKIRMDDGALLTLLLDTVAHDVEAAKGNSKLSEFVSILDKALQDVRSTTAQMSKAPNDQIYTANATLYLDMLGHVVIGWMWLRQAHAASVALERGDGGQDTSFYKGKLAACRYFYTYEMSRLAQWLPILTAADSQLVDLQNDWL